MLLVDVDAVDDVDVDAVDVDVDVDVDAVDVDVDVDVVVVVVCFFGVVCWGGYAKAFSFRALSIAFFLSSSLLSSYLSTVICFVGYCSVF